MTASPSHMWYVRAAEGVWGPYPESRIAAFVAEGRVAGETPLSPWAAGPFTPAKANAEFAAFFEPRPAHAAPAQPRAAPSPAAPLQAPEAPADGPRRPVLVLAEIGEASAPGFHAALAAMGPGVTIRPGLWLVLSGEGAAALRNRLSRRLGAADTLLVVEAPLEQAAWFNLEPARDRELRRLWSVPAAGAGRREA